jgi:hypothetical protein
LSTSATGLVKGNIQRAHRIVLTDRPEMPMTASLWTTAQRIARRRPLAETISRFQPAASWPNSEDRIAVDDAGTTGSGQGTIPARSSRWLVASSKAAVRFSNGCPSSK